MWSNCLGLISFLCTLAFANGLAHAADPTLNELAGLPVTAMFFSSGAPGMVMGLVRGSESLVGGLGETAKGNGQEPTGQSVFRLGSISKVMAGELLATLTVEGKLRLSEPLQRFAPQGKTVPTVDGRAITLLDLATHSAGLPRDIGPAPEGQTFLTWPTEHERWDYIGSTNLLWPPATIAAYSNVGYQLLGDAMAAAAGESYSALLQSHLAAPLSMTDTTVRPSAEQCARLMIGTGQSGPAPCIDTSPSAASVGVYSTGDDMVKWLRHLITGADVNAPARLIARAAYRQRAEMPVVIGFDEAGSMNGLGLGWVIEAPHDQMPLIVQKSGGAEGFMSYLAFVPGKAVGIFFVMNRMDLVTFSATAAAANSILAMLSPR
jgi:D-alanyl-D-alanine-carboxypeptidase/D-alanyl-D-alanine-endopeptidase